MSKYDGHTPGPWEWVADRYHGGYCGLFSADGYAVILPQSQNEGDDGAAWIATDADYYGETTLEAADARLIADASMLLRQRDELLAALEACIERMEDMQYDRDTTSTGSYRLSDAKDLIKRIKAEETE